MAKYFRVVKDYIPLLERKGESSSTLPFDPVAEALAGKKKLLKKLLVGTVVSFSPPASEVEADHLYRIEWEDGDAEDFSEADFIEGKKLYAIHSSAT